MIKYKEHPWPCNQDWIPTCLLYGFIYRFDGARGWYYSMNNSFLTMSNDRFNIEEYYPDMPLRFDHRD